MSNTSFNHNDYDCTRKCRLRDHGNQITAALTKRSIPDEKLAAFVAKRCANYTDIVDDLGRSAVHLAASVERYNVLEWLLNQGAIINGRDFESGSSPLHRAIYYGCIDAAVLLLRYGASLELLDEDGRCAFQNVCRLSDFSSSPVVQTALPSNETLVWGSNKNYNLGIGNEEGSQAPQSLDYFRRERISIETMALGTYHSLFLDRKRQLYVVGHGKGGRLGHGNENSLPAPKRIKLPIKNTDEYIIGVSASRMHSLLLSNRSSVYACGLNTEHQLGVRDAGEKLLVFKEVVTLRDLKVQNLKRVIACDQHSLAYSDTSIYVWGTNHGQLGAEANVKLPKLMKLPPRIHINTVESSNSATVVLTDNIILLYYNNKMKSINPPNFEPLKSVSVVGGDSVKSSKGSATALKLLLLTKTNVVFLWYEMTQNFYRCIFSPIRISQIDQIIYKSNQVLILSQGDVYRGKCHQIPVPVYAASTPKRITDPSTIWSGDNNRTEISKDHMLRIDVTRLASIDRAVGIFSNDDFSSFSVLQESAWKYFKVSNLMPVEYSFKKLLNEANEYDEVHDVVLHVDSEIFVAHKFLLYSRAPGLRALISAFEDKHVYLNFENLTGKMFELVLKYIYTNYLPNANDLDDMQQSLGPNAPEEQADVCALFLTFVEEKFQLHDLARYLKSYLEQGLSYPILPHQPDKTQFRFNRLHRTDAHAPYDVRIICADDVELLAHKCILVDRLEYFNMMFTHSWAEQTTINLNTIPIEYMEPIIDFLYSADVMHFRKQNHQETYLYNMIVYCDQFFIERLRNACEKLILDKITIRKCGDMLDFACMYNCAALKDGCVDFICQNLARVLSYKCLDQCEPEALRCINLHYRTVFKEVFDYRMITPDSEAIDDELLLSFVDGFDVDLSYRMNENEEQDLSKSGSKLKSKENKTKQATRQYEREAISSMMDAIHLDENQKSSHAHNEPSESIKETQEVAERLQAEAKNWMKVVDKKEQKKKLSLDQMLKVNEAVQMEEKSKSEYVALSKVPESGFKHLKTAERETLTSPKVPPSEDGTSPSAKTYNLNLSDYSAPREKLSQKQRKRLTSWRSSAVVTSNSPPFIEETKPMIVPQHNAWGVLPQTSPSSGVLMSLPTTGSSGDPSSFANMMRGQSAATSDTTTATASSPSSSNSFTRILAEERKQREHYERMRTKSLALTQIEETAIAELREFYNVDNVTDEIITIERKRLPPSTMNFATWQRN